MRYPGSLHTHTEYSNLTLRDSTNTISGVLKYAEELGYKVVAFTEHETVAGFIKVEEEAEKYKNKIKVIRGNEIYLTRDYLTKETYDSKTDRYYHFILLAKDAIGNKQIRQLSTRAWLRGWKTGFAYRRPTYYRDLEEIVGSNQGHIIASSACFRKGTKVETLTGWKPIEEIQTGDYVINQNGTWERVIEPTHRKVQQDGYIIEITGNDQPIICTDNHQFLVYSNNSKKLKWVQAKNLQLVRGATKHIGIEPVDYIYTQTNIIKKDEWVNSYFYDEGAKRKYHLPNEIKITPELMRLFGLFLGDGYISLKKQPKVGFAFSNKEFPIYWENFVKFSEDILNIKWCITEIKEQHKVEISCSSRELVDLFYYLFGDVKANNKRVPNRLRISKELDIELVFGYLLADGYFRTRKKVGNVANNNYSTGEFVSASISEYLSKDFYKILNNLGISTSITKINARIDKNGTNHKEAWYLSGSNKILGTINKLQSYSHKDIIKIFNQAEEYKKKDFIVFNGVRYRKIRFKKRTPIALNETVYCLNNTTHSFKCENIIVHNCLGGELSSKILQIEKTPLQQDKEALWIEIRGWINNMVRLFGKDNFYLELQPSNSIEQIYVNKVLVGLGKEMNVPWIITTDAHYRKKEDRIVHRTYLKAQNGEREVDEFYEGTYLQSDEEVCEFLSIAWMTEEDIQKAYENIMNIADRCEDYTLKKPLKIPELSWKEPSYAEEIILQKAEELYKDIPELKTFIESDVKSDSLLGKLLTQCFIDKPEEFMNKETFDEVNECLKDTRISSEVNNAHWSAYYLNLMKIIDGIWEAGSLVGPSRGSGGGFILLYMLGIIQLNCLREETPLYRWRFLNPERVSVMDVDIDCEAARRQNVLNKFRQLYGEDRVANVMTLRTETTKSAIQTACRGLGIDNDDAAYISGFVVADRGQARSLSQMYYGDENKGMAPNKAFKAEMDKRPELWQVAKAIEGIISGYGTHAGGVVFKDEDFCESGALMRSPAGEIQTQFELHDLEKAGDIKYDVLSVDALDKIHNTLDLLIADGLIEDKGSIKETYEATIGVYNLERKAPEMWKMVWEHKINALFQMEKQSGTSGIALIHPKSISELAVLNSVIRLMAQEKGEKTPLEKWAIYRKDINVWLQEMREYGLDDKDIKWLANHPNITDGLCVQQEDLMSLTMEQRLGGNSLGFADTARKVIGKKQMNKIDELRENFYKNAKDANCNMKLVSYVWDVLFKTQLGYAL